MRFDTIGIGRSFTSSTRGNSDSAGIAVSVIDLTKSLGLPVNAVGIEHLREVHEITR